MKHEFSASKLSSARKYMIDPGVLHERAARQDAVLVYQPYLKEKQRDLFHHEAIALDINFNTGPDAREYELFSTVHTYHQEIGLDENAFWSVISGKFEHKSTISMNDFLRNAMAARASGYDCYVYNPVIANNSTFLHPWEQGIIAGHTGMDKVYKYIKDNVTDVSRLQGLSTFAMCNYVCGNNKFWSGYFAFCEKVLSALETEKRSGTDIGKAYSLPAGYARDRKLTMRPFVIERLLGNYLQVAIIENNLKVAYYTPGLEDFQWKFGPRAGKVLRDLQSLKEVALLLGDQPGLKMWNDKRKIVLADVFTILRLDDPPDWFEQ